MLISWLLALAGCSFDSDASRASVQEASNEPEARLSPSGGPSDVYQAITFEGLPKPFVRSTLGETTFKVYADDRPFRVVAVESGWPDRKLFVGSANVFMGGTPIGLPNPTSVTGPIKDFVAAYLLGFAPCVKNTRSPSDQGMKNNGHTDWKGVVCNSLSGTELDEFYIRTMPAKEGGQPKILEMKLNVFGNHITAWPQKAHFNVGLPVHYQTPALTSPVSTGPQLPYLVSPWADVDTEYEQALQDHFDTTKP